MVLERFRLRGVLLGISREAVQRTGGEAEQRRGGRLPTVQRLVCLFKTGAESFPHAPAGCAPPPAPQLRRLQRRAVDLYLVAQPFFLACPLPLQLAERLLLGTQATQLFVQFGDESEVEASPIRSSRREMLGGTQERLMFVLAVDYLDEQFSELLEQRQVAQMAVDPHRVLPRRGQLLRASSNVSASSLPSRSWLSRSVFTFRGFRQVETPLDPRPCRPGAEPFARWRGRRGETSPSMTMDLPAPVSPVSTLRPDDNSERCLHEGRLLDVDLSSTLVTSWADQLGACRRLAYVGLDLTPHLRRQLPGRLLTRLKHVPWAPQSLPRIWGAMSVCRLTASLRQALCNSYTQEMGDSCSEVENFSITSPGLWSSKHICPQIFSTRCG